jgi:hypothetical protein
MMKCFASRWGLGAAFVLLGVASLVDAPKAQAQASSMTTAAPPKFIGGDAHTKAPKVAPPAALPGAQSNPDEVAPRASIDLPPNQALFDAINRGDITVARDAIGRGADLDAHNVLGMTRSTCRSISAAMTSPSCCCRCAVRRRRRRAPMPPRSRPARARASRMLSPARWHRNW